MKKHTKSNSVVVPAAPLPLKHALTALAIFATPVFAGLVFFLLSLFVPVIQDYRLYLKGTDKDFVNSFIAGLFMTFATMSAVYVFLQLKRQHLGFSAVGFRRFDMKQALKYIALFPLYYYGILLAILLLVLFMLEMAGYTLPEPSKKDASFHLLMFIISVIAAPIIEEILFRGLLLPAIAKKYGWFKGGLISSLIFAIGHGPLAMIPTFLAGIYLSRMYYRLGSIIPGIILHAINNSIAYVFLSSVS